MLDRLQRPLSESDIARLVTDHIPSMLAYWDDSQICRFANQAYRIWFGKTPAELIGTPLRSLLGPLYELNLPYIQGALRGEPQVFERRVPRPDGTGYRDSLATYTPDIADGVVRGFIAQVADVSLVKLSTALNGRHRARATDPNPGDPLIICAWCTSIQDETAEWFRMETFITALTGRSLSHGLCPPCYRRLAAKP